MSTIDVEQLSEKFCLILNEWLSEEEITEINRRNESPPFENCCATHDFCDPNQAMADALESVGFRYETEYNDLINAAWKIASNRKFQVIDAQQPSN